MAVNRISGELYGGPGIDVIRFSEALGRCYSNIDLSSEGETLSLDIILKIAGLGLLASVLHMILKQQGKEEYAFLVTTAGVVTVFLMLIGYIDELLEMIRGVFKLW